jgi:hypothetical protein
MYIIMYGYIPTNYSCTYECVKEETLSLTSELAYDTSSA